MIDFEKLSKEFNEILTEKNNIIDNTLLTNDNKYNMLTKLSFKIKKVISVLDKEIDNASNIDLYSEKSKKYKYYERVSDKRHSLILTYNEIYEIKIKLRKNKYRDYNQKALNSGGIYSSPDPTFNRFERMTKVKTRLHGISL